MTYDYENASSIKRLLSGTNQVFRCPNFDGGYLVPDDLNGI